MTRLQRRLGEAVRRLRSAAGRSQEDFADVVGVHRTTVGRLERGAFDVTLGSAAGGARERGRAPARPRAVGQVAVRRLAPVSSMKRANPRGLQRDVVVVLGTRGTTAAEDRILAHDASMAYPFASVLRWIRTERLDGGLRSFADRIGRATSWPHPHDCALTAVPWLTYWPRRDDGRSLAALSFVVFAFAARSRSALHPTLPQANAAQHP